MFKQIWLVKGILRTLRSMIFAPIGLINTINDFWKVAEVSFVWIFILGCTECFQLTVIIWKQHEVALCPLEFFAHNRWSLINEWLWILIHNFYFCLKTDISIWLSLLLYLSLNILRRNISLFLIIILLRFHFILE